MDRHIEAVIFDLGGTLIEYAGPYRSWPELETPGLGSCLRHVWMVKGVTLPDFQ